MARHSGEMRFLADVVTTQSAEAAARLSRRGGTCKGGARQIHAPRTARKVIWACCSVMIHAASGSMNVARRLDEKVDHERKNLDSSGAVDICVGRGTAPVWLASCTWNRPRNFPLTSNPRPTTPGAPVASAGSRSKAASFLHQRRSPISRSSPMLTGRKEGRSIWSVGPSDAAHKMDLPPFPVQGAHSFLPGTLSPCLGVCG